MLHLTISLPHIIIILDTGQVIASYKLTVFMQEWESFYDFRIVFQKNVEGCQQRMKRSIQAEGLFGRIKTEHGFWRFSGGKCTPKQEHVPTPTPNIQKKNRKKGCRLHDLSIVNTTTLLTRYKYSNGRTRKRGTMDDRILLISLMLRRR